MSEHSARLLSRLAELECPAFATRRQQRAELADRAPAASHGIVLARGQGCFVEDVDGKRYMDLAAGFGSVLLGHSHPAIVAALHHQSRTLIQGLGDVYASDVKIALLERLSTMHPAGDGQVMLTQSGGDAITAALKSARLATGKSGVIAFDGGYHGLGYAPLAACGYKQSYRGPFADQLGSHVCFAPYPGVRQASLDVAIEIVKQQLRDDTIGAILVEPILGRGGCVVPPDEFVPELRRLATRHGALLIADEIWTGLGRSGRMVYAREAAPDLVCFGKGLGGGVPISACVGTRDVMAAWAQGGEVVHTSTHAGAPLGCAAALATLDVLEAQDVAARVNALDAVNALKGALNVEVRGAGLMIGIELADAAAVQRASAELLQRGYLVIGGGVAGDVLTLTPPLFIEREVLLDFASVLAEIV